jgi:hypothetical protein
VIVILVAIGAELWSTGLYGGQAPPVDTPGDRGPRTDATSVSWPRSFARSIDRLCRATCERTLTPHCGSELHAPQKLGTGMALLVLGGAIFAV